ncbi:MAG TPA: RpiB/LacA/LacB family sugar-phosphate isomerase [Acidimicrobiales bacterium]
MRVVFGTDEDTGVTSAVIDHLMAGGHDVIRATTEEWPEVGRAVGRAVATGAAERGVVCCWTGTGVSIAANKVAGVRAALCTDAETARGARRWNDANVVALGLRLTSVEVAREVVDAFLTTDPEPAQAGTVGRVEAPADAG